MEKGFLASTSPHPTPPQQGNGGLGVRKEQRPRLVEAGEGLGLGISTSGDSDTDHSLRTTVLEKRRPRKYNASHMSFGSFKKQKETDEINLIIYLT